MSVLRTYTVVRFPNGEWSHGGKPNDPAYAQCDVYVVEAFSLLEARWLAKARYRAGVKRQRARRPAGQEPSSMTAQELRWVRRMEALMESCPLGMELYTIGDHYLGVVRKSVWDRLVEEGKDPLKVEGVELCKVKSGCRIHGASG